MDKLKPKNLILAVLFVFTAINTAGQSKPLRIELGEFVLTIPDISIDPHYYISIEKISEDTVFISLELGDTPAGSILAFQSLESVITGVKQRYETSITVMNEGPHLDLLDWEHYYSPWIELKKVSANHYQSIGYSRAQSEMFPKVDIEDVRQVVKRIGGEGWLEHSKESDDIHTYPFGVGFSMIEYMIEYEMQGRVKRKVLLFEIALGC